MDPWVHVCMEEVRGDMFGELFPSVCLVLSVGAGGALASGTKVASVLVGSLCRIILVKCLITF